MTQIIKAKQRNLADIKKITKYENCDMQVNILHVSIAMC